LLDLKTSAEIIRCAETGVTSNPLQLTLWPLRRMCHAGYLVRDEVRLFRLFVSFIRLSDTRHFTLRRDCLPLAAWGDPELTWFQRCGGLPPGTDGFSR